jgi:hypothetical protein
MKNHSFALAFVAALLVTSVSAQDLPARAVTIFKNNRSLVERTGVVNAPQGRYVSRTLPDALFGTFWASTPAGQLRSVYTVVDSVMQPVAAYQDADYYAQIAGQSVRIYLDAHADTPSFDVMEGAFEPPLQAALGGNLPLIFRSTKGGYFSFNIERVKQVEFLQPPIFKQKSVKKAEKRLEVNFDANRTQQNLSLSYLTSGIGWTPVYRLELTGKNKGRLALRAEVVNDAEDLSNAELRLAVGIPNFAMATRASDLVTFAGSGAYSPQDIYVRGNRFDNVQTQAVYGGYDEVQVSAPSPNGDDPEGSRAEDFYFYTIRPGAFPKNSRYQYPIFEVEVTPTHFYECVLPYAGPQRVYESRNNQRGRPEDDLLPVAHYAEFVNSTAFPWTTGVTNVLSATQNGDFQPISQDKLPYAAPGAKCKVRIAETPEVKVTHSEGDVKREENVQEFFNRNYDRVTLEGQVCVVNYKSEPVTLKIKRTVEGKPLSSPDLDWQLRQEAATLRVNSEYVAEWQLTLKPGEERKWKYRYEVLVDF